MKVFTVTLRELDSTEKVHVKKINCKHPSIWPQGHRLVNFLRVKTEHAITGKIVFNDQGKDFKIITKGPSLNYVT